jgi:hypothetical protein
MLVLLDVLILKWEDISSDIPHCAIISPEVGTLDIL